MTEWSKFKAFKYNINVAKMAKCVLDRVENIARKGENAGIQHFLHFTQYFLLSQNKFKYLSCINFANCEFFQFNPFPRNDTFLTPLGRKPFENTVGKGEIARNEQFLLFPQCFLPVWITFCHFHQNLKLSVANSFNLEESKICHVVMG